MLKRFLVPMLIGYVIGIISGVFEFEFVVRLLFTISSNFLQLILFVAPFLVLVFAISGTNDLRGNLKSFIFRFFGIIFSSLLLVGGLTLVTSNLILPSILMEMEQSKPIFLDPYFVLDIQPMFSVISGMLAGILFGSFLEKDSKTMDIVRELEKWIAKFSTSFLLPLMPIWIMGTFAKAGFVNQGVEILYNDFVMSWLIIGLQFLWLGFMYFIASKYSGVSFKMIVREATKIYIKVVSIMGMGTGIIIPFVVKAQEDIGVDSGTAKIVSASSLNMPGSVISNIVFSYGIIIMFNIDISLSTYLIYVVMLVLATMIAPAVTGGVFAVNSGLLTPILGFTPDQISIMGSFYYTQGTSNSATNNSADLYLGPILSKK